MTTYSSGDEVNREELEKVINQITTLDEVHKQFLKNRWLHHVMLSSKRAQDSYRKYHILRSIVVIGGVLIPTLVSLNINESSSVIRWITVGLGLLVAISAALEGIFRFGDVWREEQRAAELLLSEGWRFFQLSGQYSTKRNHQTAYSYFAAQVESLILREVESYLATAKEQKSTNTVEQDATESPEVVHGDSVAE
jgi:hypothetical protein